MKGLLIKLCISVIAICLLSGCATTLKPVCRHNAVLAALVAGERYPVRLAFGQASGHWQNHVEAQAFIDNEWQCLKVLGNSIQTGSCDKYTIWEYMTVQQFIHYEWKGAVK